MSRKRPGFAGQGGHPASAQGTYNNDGFEDLLITYWGGIMLYRNNGDGTFSDVTAASGFVPDRTCWYRDARFSITTAMAIWTSFSQAM